MDTLLRHSKGGRPARLPALNAGTARQISAVTEAVCRMLTGSAPIFCGDPSQSAHGVRPALKSARRAGHPACPSPPGVINATGTVPAHQSGPACLSDRALAAARGVSQGYSTWNMT